MSNLAAVLAERKAAGRKSLVPYVTGGLSADWTRWIDTCVEGGADALEVGIPFSDPMMDGPVIQEASQLALDRGVSPSSVLKDLEGYEATIPLAVMTYANLALRPGLANFAQDLVSAGVSAAILPDLSLEEMAPWAEVADAHAIATVMLVAPTTSQERVEAITDRARGFVYAVARLGVTGERPDLEDSYGSIVEGIRSCTELPILVGVGISGAKQAAAAAEVADGVIVGSALMRRILAGEHPQQIVEFLAEIREALDR
ncbi:MAG: tryptophan synthase subunit alpha [Actinomycetota bacterium]